MAGRHIESRFGYLNVGLSEIVWRYNDVWQRHQTE